MKLMTGVAQNTQNGTHQKRRTVLEISSLRLGIAKAPLPVAVAWDAIGGSR